MQDRAKERKRRAAERKLELATAEVVALFLISGKLDAFSITKHGAQWRSTLQTFAIPTIGFKLLGKVCVSDIKAVLAPI